MLIKVSTKGQVVLPGSIRRRFDIRAGDALEANIEDGRIILTPGRKRSKRAKIAVNPNTGFPAVTAGANAPRLTGKDIDALLDGC